MVKIKIKIEDLFENLDLNDPLIGWNNDIISTSPPIKISVKNHEDKFVPINWFIKKKVDSYKITLNDNASFISSLNHTLLTSNGEKQIKDIYQFDKLSNKRYISNITPYKTNDTLYDLSIPKPYLFKDSNNIIHHNSLILTYIWKTLYENSKIHNVILVVPTINLVTQFKADMVEYGIDKSIIGEVHADAKEWNKKIVISTWQTLINNLDKLEMFGSIFVDECLDGNTLITLSDKSKKKISEIKIGDNILSYNKEKNIFEKDEVIKIHKNLISSNSEDFYKLEFDDGNILKVTGNHKILTENRGYIRADSLTEKDEILNYFL